MNKLQKTLFVFLILSLVLLGGCAGDSSELPAEAAPETDTADVSAGQEETAPIFIAFEGTDLDGNTVSQEIFTQSKLTMVNVWATYCNPCLREMPALGELAEDYAPETFQIIGIVSDVLEGDDQSLVEKLVQQTGAAYPHLLLNESLYYGLLLDVTAVPTTFFIDGNGAIVDTVIGAMEKSAWEEKINGLLEEG